LFDRFMFEGYAGGINLHIIEISAIPSFSLLNDYHWK